MRIVKQLDYSIGDTFVSRVLEEVSVALIHFKASWMEKPYASVMNTWRLIRKYGRYHRPIARTVLFWLNDHGSGSPNTGFVMSTVSRGAFNERRTSRSEEL
jgi:hypothetical protein